MRRAAPALLLLGLCAGGAEAPAEEPAAALPPAERAAARLGLVVDSGAPLTITAADALVEGGGKHFIFKRDVEVVQGDLRISCDEAEAVYGAGQAEGPESIRGRGDVRIRQGDVEVRCAEAEYRRVEQRAVCRGGAGLAQLRRGEDVVRGSEIHFDLARGVLSVKGGARVVIDPGAGKAP